MKSKIKKICAKSVKSVQSVVHDVAFHKTLKVNKLWQIISKKGLNLTASRTTNALVVTKATSTQRLLGLSESRFLCTKIVLLAA